MVGELIEDRGLRFVQYKVPHQRQPSFDKLQHLHRLNLISWWRRLRTRDWQKIAEPRARFKDRRQQLGIKVGELVERQLTGRVGGGEMRETAENGFCQVDNLLETDRRKQGAFAVVMWFRKIEGSAKSYRVLQGKMEDTREERDRVLLSEKKQKTTINTIAPIISHLAQSNATFWGTNQLLLSITYQLSHSSRVLANGRKKFKIRLSKIPTTCEQWQMVYSNMQLGI